MKEKKILIIHPKDKTTSFLDKIKNHLIQSFKELMLRTKLLRVGGK